MSKKKTLEELHQEKDAISAQDDKYGVYFGVAIVYMVVMMLVISVRVFQNNGSFWVSSLLALAVVMSYIVGAGYALFYCLYLTPLYDRRRTAIDVQIDELLDSYDDA